MKRKQKHTHEFTFIDWLLKRKNALCCVCDKTAKELDIVIKI
jgi:hypothetical protein